jgi:hypothetical protein
LSKTIVILQIKNFYLAHSSGGWTIQGHGAGICSAPTEGHMAEATTWGDGASVSALISLFSLKQTPMSSWGPTLLISSNPDHLPKAPPFIMTKTQWIWRLSFPQMSARGHIQPTGFSFMFEGEFLLT